MSARGNRDLSDRIADLENAMMTIGQISSDPTITPKRRIERTLGILAMYECAPPSPRALEEVLS